MGRVDQGEDGPDASQTQGRSAMVKDRPLIGINTDLRIAAKGRPAVSSIHSGYYDCILTAGGIPVVIPPLTKEMDLLPIIEQLDGIVLTEGDDLDPIRQGLGAHPSIRKVLDRREVHDRLLCKFAQARKMPVLGIGLGMQELVVTMGGGLYQHLPEDLPRSIPHYDPQGGLHRHIVTMVRNSLCEDIYGEGEIRVNSYHHQGVRKLPPGFRVGAEAPDGVIEAIEWKHPEDWFCVGLQWHPHKEGTVSLDMQMIEAFVSAAGKAEVHSVPAPKLSVVSKAG
jgi:putative glutamine amidotransferase